MTPGFSLYSCKSMSQTQFTTQKWKASSQTDANQDKEDTGCANKRQTDKQTAARTDKNPTCTWLRCLSTFHSDCREINSFFHHIQMIFFQGGHVFCWKIQHLTICRKGLLNLEWMMNNIALCVSALSADVSSCFYLGNQSVMHLSPRRLTPRCQNPFTKSRHVL